MNEILMIAREAIKSKLESKEPKIKVIEELKEMGACFVTLTKKGELRGCIGHLEPVEPLYKNIINNAINAAFNDPRFLPLKKEELEEIKIEVSILTQPQKLEYEDEEDLLRKLTKEEGVILKKGFRQSTFLPQVWEQIQRKEDFLNELCLKAGLPLGTWKEAEIHTYKVQKFSE